MGFDGFCISVCGCGELAGLLNMLISTGCDSRYSLLNREGSITIEDLREHFRLNDFSAMSSGYNKGKESDAHNNLFNKIVAHFKKAWRGQVHGMTGKYLSVFSSSSPVGCMEKSE